MAMANALIAVGEVKESNDTTGSKRAFDEAAELGRALNYGYATFRANAGLRRLATQARTQEHPQGRKPAARKPVSVSLKENPGAKTSREAQAAPLADGDKNVLGELEDRVTKTYGAPAIAQLTQDPQERRKILESMLPDARMWTVVLMCDIRGYTTAMARTDPEDQVDILNQYLARATQIIQNAGGGVDKYMGDAVLGFFLPNNLEEEIAADRALKVADALNAATALVTDPELNALFAQFRARFRDLDETHFGIGVGVTSGQAKFGVIGARERREYTLIGRPVNQVARVQGCARAGEVVCTGESWGQLPAVKHRFERAVVSIPECELTQRLKGFEQISVVRVTRTAG